jgi:hypothetical protein
MTIQYLGKNALVNTHYLDGKLAPAIGTHSFQVLRANRAVPPDADGLGYTYNHAPMLAYWKGRFYIEYLCSHHNESGDPTITMLTRSSDGRTWDTPRILFPTIEWKPGKFTIAHQRMGFFVASNGRLLALSFYGIWDENDVTRMPNKGQGLGRAVREIYEDGSFGPIHFLRYMPHAGYTEETTQHWYPFFERSEDEGFKEACRAILANKLVTQQMWEEDRAKDGFFALDDSTPGFNCKALSFYHRADGKVVGLWKGAWAALSEDEGKTWSRPVQISSKPTTQAKEWGQRTTDGRYAIVYNPTMDNDHRYPLVVITSNDGIDFDNMLLVNGEVPHKRYPGWHKEHGQQYVRGIVEGNGVPPDGGLWVVYSMNKEDIWISRVPVPVQSEVAGEVHDNFEDMELGGFVKNWNVYSPVWAPVTIEEEVGNRFLQLADSDPTDMAKAVRVFPRASHLTISFRVRAVQGTHGRLDIDVTTGNGTRLIRLTLDGATQAILANVMARQQVVTKFEKDTWHTFVLEIDGGNYRLLIDGLKYLDQAPLGALLPPPSERIEFRTGAYRREVGLVTELEEALGPALPGSEAPEALALFHIDDVTITYQ